MCQYARPALGEPGPIRAEAWALLDPRALPAVAPLAEYLEVAHRVRAALAVGDDVVEFYPLVAATLDAPTAVAGDDGLLHGPRYGGTRRLVRVRGAQDWGARATGGGVRETSKSSPPPG